MKADMPKEERQRLEREQWTEIRAALVRRHFQVTQDQQAIDSALAYRDMHLLPGLMVELERIATKPAAEVAVLVSAPAEPMPAVEPPVPAPRNRAVAAVPGLRANFGLT